VAAFVRGIALKLARVERRVSQGELARAAGWSRQSVSRLEQRDLVPNTLATRFLAALDQSVKHRGGL
jgi:transcriptional regulator with XRE-family HTH domain